MRKPTHLSFFLQPAAFVAAFLLAVAPASAKVLANVNLSKKLGHDAECAIAQNPTNQGQLFALCNTGNGFGPAALFAARSADGGATWVYPNLNTETIADGTLGPAACCDPSLAWDSFGNLFITYLDNRLKNIVTLLSKDGGQTFSTLATFGPANTDQPTVTADAGAVWIAWNQDNQMVASGARVTALGKVGDFMPKQKIPGTGQCNFGDIAIAPGGPVLPRGAVVQVCESPSNGSGPASLLVNIKKDGLGLNPFDSPITATTTNVGGFYIIPAQNVESIDAEAGFAFDRNQNSPHFGRLYLVYTDAPAPGDPNTNIMLRFSDDGVKWSDPIRVNDSTTNSKFLPRIASDPRSGNIAICWHDCRNSEKNTGMKNTAMQEFCTIATPTGTTPVFNAQISAGSSISNGKAPEFGDYSGLAYFNGVAHPIWADTSNSTRDNPDGTANFDAYTAPVTGGIAAK